MEGSISLVGLARSGLLTPAIVVGGFVIILSAWFVTGKYLKRHPEHALPLSYFFGGVGVGMLLLPLVGWLTGLLL